jgi:hypothetical protein
MLEITRKRPNVILQVLPFGAGASVGLEGAFTHLEFPDEERPAIEVI